MEENKKFTDEELIEEVSTEDDAPVEVIYRCAKCGQILSKGAKDCWKCSSKEIEEVVEEETKELKKVMLQARMDKLEYDLKSLRDTVSVVLQKNVLFSGTIKENLLWGDINATDEEIEEACKLSCAYEFINTFKDKYDHHIEQGGTNVSGGQKQRLCIARALLKKPKVLILDDSTSAVDTRTDKMIRESFKNYLPETTKIIISQRISSIEDADRIIVLDDGKITGIGTHEELLKDNAIYQEVYQTQKKGDE
jgi:ATP-binding cassette subfamily B protein